MIQGSAGSNQKNSAFSDSVARASTAGAVIRDVYSHGARPDVISNREHPYSCEICRVTFMVATQLSDHLRVMHGVIRHASMIKPTNQQKVDLSESDEEEGQDDNDDD